MLCLFIAFGAHAQSSSFETQFNLDFEIVSDNQYTPAFWKKIGTSHKVTIDVTDKVKGKASLLIFGDEKHVTSDSNVSLFNHIFSDFKGDSIELSGYLKTENVKGRAGLCLIVMGKNGILTANEMKENNLNGTKAWRKYAIKLPLTDSTKSIYLAVYHIGSGKVWADDFKLSIDGRPFSTSSLKTNSLTDTTAKDLRYQAVSYAAEFGNIIVNPLLLNDRNSPVSSMPSAFKFNPFYKKYLNAAGLPIIGSNKVSDKAFYKTREVMLMMLAKIPAIKEKLLENNARIAIIGKDELTTDLPEYHNLSVAMNSRVRGFGGSIGLPLTSCAEENVLCSAMDRYFGEDILIHEFAHTIHLLGISELDLEFNTQLTIIYSKALIEGLWKNTYAISSPTEYFAEGVQSWYGVNKFSEQANGIHNQIDTHEKLKSYDPRLYNLIEKFFAYDKTNVSCHQKTNYTNPFPLFEK
ncbi:MAG: hypothetical protein P0Y49_07180 [Candidatus Pedobacter colombiensis]|uniref:Uncharacterized protein n=1 Tax=Candidatus Pedobacter colombiensis TaxID=3121371 RepID=A0AAJ5W8Z9_9SPHI|nr:hypothetical protein [Pedobacter sp.]WEK20918.1 MAG: hypothetical protein P0Y49_07180 [Pedobacter sp.]